MVNENKIRILYVQPGKYPEERFVANEVHPLQRLVGGYQVPPFLLSICTQAAGRILCSSVNSYLPRLLV